MLDFDYYNPTHIVFGQKRLSQLDKLVPADAKVMVTFGGQSAKKFGTIDQVRQALGAERSLNLVVSKRTQSMKRSSRQRKWSKRRG